MPSKINNASIAVLASDDDILLFFECVLAEELNLSLYLDFQIENVLQRRNEFDCLLIDFSTAIRQKRMGQWPALKKVFGDKIFILTHSAEIFDCRTEFESEAKLFPYPFTKRAFYLFFNGVFFEPLNKSPRPKKAKPQIDEKALRTVPQFSRLLGSCEKLNEIKRKILMVADTDTPLIFFGESGTGKTMAAQIVHELSLRKNKPFVIANMANGNKEVFESILFGSVRGAFTDARDRDGLFKKADTGTLFMDEIAELSLECQAKLLRVIETGIFRPLGSDEEFKSDVRLIFATNADLRAMVKKRLFREDLYWRIVDFPIEVPALRERREDFQLLIEKELLEIKKKLPQDFSITEEAVEKMRECEWPGNFRQFKACLRRAAILSRDTGVIDEDAISF